MPRAKKADPNPLEVTSAILADLQNSADWPAAAEYADAPADPVEAALPPATPTEDVVIDSTATSPVTEDSDPAASPDESEFPDFLLQASGLTKEQAKGAYSSPEALAQAIHAFDARTIQVGAQTLQRGQPAPTPPPTTPIPEESASPDQYEMPAPSHEGEWDEDAKRLVESLRQYHDRQLAKRDAEIAAQREALQQLMAQQHSGEQITYVTQFDNFVSRLGERWSPVFGQGSGTALPRDGMAFANRIQLDSAAAQLAAGRRALGAADLPVEDLLARALFVAFPEHVKTEARQDVTDQLEARRQQFTSRPSSSKGATPSGRDRAVRHADDWYKAKGLGSDGIFDTSVL